MFIVLLGIIIGALVSMGKLFSNLDTKIDSVAAELRQDLRDLTVRIDKQSERMDKQSERMDQIIIAMNQVVLIVGEVREDMGELRGDIKIIQNHLGLPRTA
jgi:methyl-accepting chemotaxis protein